MIDILFPNSKLRNTNLSFFYEMGKRICRFRYFLQIDIQMLQYKDTGFCHIAYNRETNTQKMKF